jgi:plastocyanin
VRIARTVTLVCALTLALPALVFARGANPQGTQDITTGDDFFQPERVSALVGGQSFRWAWGPPGSLNDHNVRQDDRIFYSGPLAPTGEFTITPSAGTFGYYCELHGFEGGGMAGEIRVKPIGAANGKKAAITWATPDTDTGTRFDVRQKVGKKPPKLVEEKTRDLEGSFKLKPGKNQFQVRSREGKATSDWSPKLNLKG